MTRTHTFNSIFLQLLYVFAGILLLTCQQASGDRTDISDYYFPYDHLKKGVVYEYRSLNDPALEPEYWLYQSKDSAQSRFLYATLYRSDGNIGQRSIEEYVDNGILQRSLEFYLYDSSGQAAVLEAAVLQDNVFPFFVRDAHLVYLYKVRYTQPEHTLTVTLVRNRRFRNLATDTIFGTGYHTAKFSVVELLETKAEGYTESEWHGTELYGKDIGLIYYKKEINPMLTLEYGLYDRYPLKDLELE